MRDNPFEEIERMFERMSEQFEGMQPKGLPAGPGMEMGTGTVLVDVEDRDDAFVVTADLPGFDREEIEVNLRDDTLELSASRETAEETETSDFVRRERRRSDVSRSIRLPEPVDAEGTTAVHENGVLTVTLPKQTPEESGGTDIPVN